MKTKIAIPSNKIYSKLVANAQNVCEDKGYELYTMSESKCNEMMLRNRVDAALVTPLGYTSGPDVADLRIIPGPVLFSSGYTKLVSLFFTEGLSVIKSIASTDPDDYIMKIGKILLAERYGIQAEFVKSQGTKEKLLKNFDSAMLWSASFHGDNALDISEEWFVSYETQLPLAFWVVRNEEHPGDIENTIRAFAVDDLGRSEIYDDTDDYRKGSLIWMWEDNLEEALNHTIHLLYYHQLIPEIAAIKILGKDEEGIME